MNAAPLRVGIVGLGLAGAGMVRALVSHPNCVLAGAAEPHDLLRQRFSDDFDCPVFADIKDLVASDDIDAIYLATPHQFHKDHAVLAANNGKHIIVEKPMALTVADCEQMIEAAEQNGVALVVGHTHAFDPIVETMASIIASERLGRLSMITMMNYTNFLYRPRRPEELDSARGGGILFNQVPHQVDIARFLACSSVTTVRAHTTAHDNARPTEGSCTALLGFENGVAASLVYSGYDYFDSDELCDWVAENGQPKVAGHGDARRALSELGGSDEESQTRSTSYGYGGNRRRVPAEGAQTGQPHFGVLVVSCEKGDMRPYRDGVLLYDASGVSEIPLAPSDGTFGRNEVLSELWTAVQTKKPAARDGHFGKDTVAACLAIQASANENREIQIAQESKSIS
ncbi:MAG: Gfo/Idh/MocA family oxidoreductase [Marinosulfonomonas sp.]|nr:Gfo/Idh/MocA family oxidoreductase [Marinosulfonomonas sp.]